MVASGSPIGTHGRTRVVRSRRIECVGIKRTRPGCASLQRTYGTELSHETISKNTDGVLDEVREWQHRPLEEIYPIIYLDALVVKVRDGHQVRNRHAHIAVGVDLDGIKHVLGIWVQATEGAKFWAGVCAELANRGVKDVLIVCFDGLTGFPTRSRRPGPEPPCRPAWST